MSLNISLSLYLSLSLSLSVSPPSFVSYPTCIQQLVAGLGLGVECRLQGQKNIASRIPGSLHGTFTLGIEGVHLD